MRGRPQNVDFAGAWMPLYHEDGPERLPGPELGDYTGIPVNEAARLRGDSYDADRISVVTEYQCRQHGGDYSMRGLATLRINSEIDPATQRLLAFHTRIGFQSMERTIWLDGRAHPPPEAVHTWQGFSTGVWEGNMLSITTTHLKASYLRRNGLPATANRTFTEHWMKHGEFLTVVTVIDDPALLTEPLVRSQSWVLDPGQRMGQTACEYVTEIPDAAQQVPHHLPGTNPWLHEFAETYGLPFEATRGGARDVVSRVSADDGTAGEAAARAVRDLLHLLESLRLPARAGHDAARRPAARRAARRPGARRAARGPPAPQRAAPAGPDPSR